MTLYCKFIFSVASENRVVDRLVHPSLSGRNSLAAKRDDYPAANDRISLPFLHYGLAPQCIDKIQLKPGLVTEYRLPTLGGNVYKHRVLDPRLNTAIVLPERETLAWEKLTPGVASTEVSDPAPAGRPIVEKLTMPYLMRIRHRKMKKHKLKRLRKRMIFLNRKLAEVKRKKKEAILRSQEAQYAKWGQDFNPSDYISKELEKARRGGFKVDIFHTRSAS